MQCVKDTDKHKRDFVSIWTSYKWFSKRDHAAIEGLKSTTEQNSFIIFHAYWANISMFFFDVTTMKNRNCLLKMAFSLDMSWPKTSKDKLFCAKELCDTYVKYSLLHFDGFQSIKMFINFINVTLSMSSYFYWDGWSCPHGLLYCIPLLYHLYFLAHYITNLKKQSFMCNLGITIYMTYFPCFCVQWIVIPS